MALSQRHIIVSVPVERERPELLAQLRNRLAAQEHVQQAYYVTGEADFVLVVTAADTKTSGEKVVDEFATRIV